MAGKCGGRWLMSAMQHEPTLPDPSQYKILSGQIFNLVCRNFWISELAMRVRDALKEVGVQIEIRTDYSYNGVRSYRVSGQKLEWTLDFSPTISVEESVHTMVSKSNY